MMRKNLELVPFAPHHFLQSSLLKWSRYFSLAATTTTSIIVVIIITTTIILHPRCASQTKGTFPAAASGVSRCKVPCGSAADCFPLRNSTGTCLVAGWTTILNLSGTNNPNQCDFVKIWIHFISTETKNMVESSSWQSLINLFSRIIMTWPSYPLYGWLITFTKKNPNRQYPNLWHKQNATWWDCQPASEHLSHCRCKTLLIAILNESVLKETSSKHAGKLIGKPTSGLYKGRSFGGGRTCMLENMFAHHVEHAMALPPALPARTFPRPSSPVQLP